MARERSTSEAAAPDTARHSPLIALHAEMQAQYAIEAARAVNEPQRLAYLDAQRASIASLTRAILDDDHLQRTSLATSMAADRLAWIRQENEDLAAAMRAHARAALRASSTVIPEAVQPSTLRLPSAGIAGAWRKVGAYISEGMLAARAKLSNG